ncbi:MAG: diacylglycerol kinase [Pseudomonadales bacterium]|nr:diacylglycerol kinase [Pseudomonadales bacterium]
MNKPGRTGIKRIYYATGYSIKGIKAAWINESAFRQELSLMALMLPAAFWLGQTAEQRILLIVPLFIVVIAELFNSAIEAVVARIGPEHHILSGQAKDMGSAAVFFCLILVGISWGLTAWQRFL